METMPIRKLPVGIQDFTKLREENFLYVDKTALVYRMAVSGNPIFLSRPRRFGKSLLLSLSKAGAKVLLFFDMTKYFRKKMQKKCIFLNISVFFSTFARFFGYFGRYCVGV